MTKHLKFFARTVLVKDNNVAQAYQNLQRFLREEKVIKNVDMQTWFRRPYEKRVLLSIARCKRIYNREMNKKVEFALRKNRKDPFPR